MKTIETFKVPLSKIPQKVDKYIKWFQSKSSDMKVSGTYNFFVDLSIQGESPYQTSTISINCFTKSDRAIPIPNKCQWFRRYESREYHFNSISNRNTYQLNAEDLNSTLRIEVMVLEDGYNGTAIVEYGPIRLDPNTRHALEGILSAGGSKFPAKTIQFEDQIDNYENFGSVSLTDDCIRIIQDLKGGKSREIQFRYSYDQPKMEISTKSSTEVSLSFTGNESYYDKIIQFTGKADNSGQKIVLALCSRASRDLFMLAIKCFSTRNYLIDSRALSEVLNAKGNQKNFGTGEGNDKGLGDIFLEVESIRREINCLMHKNAELLNEKKELQEGIKVLEEELKSTIEIYSRSLSSASERHSLDQRQSEFNSFLERIERLQKENDTLVKENKKLQNEIVIYKLMESNVEADKENIPGIANNNQKNELCFKHEMEINDLKIHIEKLLAQKAALERELKHHISPKISTVNPNTREDKLTMLENRVKESKNLNEMLLNQFEQQKIAFRMLEAENSELKQNANSVSIQGDLISKIDQVPKMKLVLRRDSLKQINELTTEKRSDGSLKDVSRLERENLLLKSKIAQAEATIQSLNNKIQSLEVSAIERERSSQENQILKEKFIELQIENEHTKKTINALKSSGISVDKKSLQTVKSEDQNQQLRQELETVKKRYEEAIQSYMQRNIERQSVPNSQDSELRKELERIKNENECLVMQRNQISKKVEALQKELTSKDKEIKRAMQDNKQSPSQSFVENLKKTNERLVIENSELFYQIQNLHNELKTLK